MIRNITKEDLKRIDVEFSYNKKLSSLENEISCEYSKIQIRDDNNIDAFIIVSEHSLKEQFGMNPKSQNQDKVFWEQSYKIEAMFFNRSIQWDEDSLCKLYEELGAYFSRAAIFWFTECSADAITKKDVELFNYIDYDDEDNYFFIYI